VVVLAVMQLIAVLAGCLAHFLSSSCHRFKSSNMKYPNNALAITVKLIAKIWPGAQSHSLGRDQFNGLFHQCLNRQSFIALNG